MARKNPKKKTNDFFVDDVVEAPTEGASIFKTPDRAATFYRWLLRINVFLMLPLMGVAIFGMAAQNFMGDDGPPPGREESVSEHRPLAEQAVHDWLATDPMPGIDLLGWSYAVTIDDRDEVIAQLQEDETLPDDPAEVAAIDSTEVHFFNLTSSNDNFYTASVQIAYNPVEGARLTSDVTLIADEPMLTQPNVTELDGEDTEVTDGIARSVQSWGEAYYSAEPDTLKLAIGDGRDGYGYVPMPEADEVNATVLSAIVHPSAETSEDSPAPDIVYARVQIEVTWPLPEFEEEELAEMEEVGTVPEPQETTISYDVLIEEADTQAPTVVAWGPVGDYEQLGPFSNAVEGREFEAPQLDNQPGHADPTESTGPVVDSEEPEESAEGDGETEESAEPESEEENNEGTGW